MRRALLSVVLAAALAVGIPSADARYEGRGDPVVISGAELTRLDGVSASRLVAFGYVDPRRGKDRWKQVPVQLDERMVVDFGANPPSNAQVGVEGTVYGTQPIGQTVLQYADPDTFVGADPDPGVDADDEIALLAADAGDKAGRRATRPARTTGKATRVKIADPLGGPDGFVYLYRAKGSAIALASKDYVSYDFRLASGDYRSSYRRADGPNPETSTITTKSYEIGFSDRWYYDSLKVRTGGASGVDILDGFKFQFGPNTCGRSERTFNDAEGAFVANVDGPVRAIRSYIGANSGPLTQRTHLFYPDRHVILTDLRVHAVPGPLTYHDLSPAGIGMTYSNFESSAGVPVDGSPEIVSNAVPRYHLWTGPQGSLLSTDRVQSSFATELLNEARGWYLDQLDVPAGIQQQCWGDDDAIGQGGLYSTYGMPNTDPRNPPAATMRAITTDVIAGPGMPYTQASELSSEIDQPLETIVR